MNLFPAWGLISMDKQKRMESKDVKEPLIFERSQPGRTGVEPPELDVPERPLDEYIPAEHLRNNEPELPEVSELDVVRHFTRLSQETFGIDTNFYPLGSCTMKFNPKINEKAASMPSFNTLHPAQPDETVQGTLEVMHKLQASLAEISGMDCVTLNPAAGAHGELTGLMLIKKRLQHEGKSDRDLMLIPDSAHGTNPASCTLCGFDTAELESGEDGRVSVENLKEHLSDRLAGLMITNPSTLGLFESDIQEICELVHEAGGYVYMDGANMNAIMGITKPGEFGVDVMHFNLHKTFSSPHGGGGPGSGPVGAKEGFADFLPVPVVRHDDEENTYYLDEDLPNSIGKIKGFQGHPAVHLRAYCYIRAHGGDGLENVSRTAILNANYLKEKVQDILPVAYEDRCMHEFVLTGTPLKEHDLRTLDVAKRLLDYGIHPPTIYFPLIVKEALMIEPAETESRQTLDRFASVLEEIMQEAEEFPELLEKAPHNRYVSRPDEVQAARHPVLRWTKEGEEAGE